MKKRKDGRYRASITVGYTPEGKQKRKYVYANSQRELNDKLAELRLKLNKGIAVDEKDITVSQWADKWLELYKEDTVAYNTLRGYKNAVETYIKPSIGYYKLRDIRTHHIQEIIKNMQKQGLSVDSMKKVKITLQQMYQKAIGNDIAFFNPADAVELPTNKKKSRKPLSDEYIEIIKEVSKTHKAGIFMLTLLYSGIRTEEAIPLTWKDIDLKNRLIYINKAIYFKNNQPELKDVKTENSNRSVPILLPLLEILKKHEAKSKSIYVFPSAQNKMMSETSLRRLKESFQLACDKLYKEKHKDSIEKGLQLEDFHFTLHQFRHTCATMLQKAGVSPKEAQMWLGHSSISVTMDIYTHLEDNYSAADKLNKFLGVK